MANRILVVEDSAPMRDFVVASLESAGSFEVVAVESGIRALQEAARGDWAAVVTDINMPDISGIELIRMLRGQRALSDVRILAISTDGATTDIERAMKAGADSYLVKPFSADDLVRSLAEIQAGTS